MSNKHLNNPKSPKYHVKRFIEDNKAEFENKTVIDLPAGTGITSQILDENHAKVLAFDLFPEYFTYDKIKCQKADVMSGIPLDEKQADWLICQEGIEHFSDQLKVLKEFNRVLKPNAKMLITTPSYSKLSARFSYLLFESETNKQMPPNEIDDIWMEDKSVSSEIYYGHIFLIGLQKLRILAKLSGFKIKEIKYIRISKGSLFLLPFFYPWILISSYFRYKANLRKHENIPMQTIKDIYREQFKINVSIPNLINHHTFVVFEKENDFDKISFRQESVMRDFKLVT